MSPRVSSASIARRRTARPRIGFLGVGWIGRSRLEAVHQSGHAEIAAIADVSPELQRAAAQAIGGCPTFDALEPLLELGLDGVMIATPSSLHAEQCVRALENGLAVFCQKPLGRTAVETRRVVDAARAADRLLGVDFSYRHVRGMPEIRRLVQSGGLGRVFAIDLVFHNAYGPDKAWFYDARQSGGGCVMDLGIHLLDLALWVLKDARVDRVHSRLFSQGAPLRSDQPGVAEDFAEVQLELSTGAVARLSCSWKAHVGSDSIIEAVFYGTAGGAALRNVNGSFYDFVVERFTETTREVLSRPPDAWGGRAAVEWAEKLAWGGRYSPELEQFVATSAALDRIYGR